MSLLQVVNASFGYEKNVVLKDVNFTVEAGDFICIVGPNGSGKSTLVKGILGIIKPFKGKVKYEELKPNFIGYMPQETKVDAAFPASVWEIVLSGNLNKMKGIFYSQELKEATSKVLQTLHISKLKDACFADLSGGERQKVLLARSLCATSKLLILDEPSNNLDFKSKQNLYQILLDLNKKNGITIIMITHDLDHRNLIGNKILSLQEDEIFFGSTKEFVRRIHHD